MSGKNKNIPVPCKMFLRFLKEGGLFHEWRVECEKRLKEDSINLVSNHGQKFYSFAEKWRWYISQSNAIKTVMQENQIYAIINRTLCWASTKRGHEFWKHVHYKWGILYYKYHTARKIESAVHNKPMTDDLDAFKCIKDELISEAHNLIL